MHSAHFSMKIQDQLSTRLNTPTPAEPAPRRPASEDRENSSGRRLNAFQFGASRFDGEALGGFAARLNYVGEHERALALFDASRMLTPRGVKWRDYGYFLAHLGMGDREAAVSAGIGLRGLDNKLYLAAVAISASIRGDTALAQVSKRTLLKREPNLRWMFERRAYAPDLIERLMQHLDAIDPPPHM